jgi:uncharacterized coiled-coil protein SlyX
VSELSRDIQALVEDVAQLRTEIEQLRTELQAIVDEFLDENRSVITSQVCARTSWPKQRAH